jgi:hypothetical protein
MLFLQAPGAALELLLFASPLVVAVWLIVALTARRRSGVTRRHLPALPDSRERVPRADEGCALCPARTATLLAVRRPARRRHPEPDGRYLPLCDDCAAKSVLPKIPAR